MLHDLVSPWAAALLDARRNETGLDAFRARHASLLEALRLQRAPHAATFPLATSRTQLRSLADRAAEPERQQRLRDLVAFAGEEGVDAPANLFLIAGADDGEPVEPLPVPLPRIVLFLDRCPGEDSLAIALARGLVAITRWTAARSESPVRTASVTPWDRWRLAQEIPLGEWLYTEALGLHLAQRLLPDLPPHQLLGVTKGALHRLREREHALRALLEEDLDQAGIGLLLRWLIADSPASARRRGKVVIPARAGIYLAWRMLEARVTRVGIGEAAQMASGA